MCAEAHRGGISMNKFIERSYLAAFFLCAAVFLFMFATFRIDIRQRQTQEGFGEVTDYRREIVADAACPTGQKSVYTFSLGQLSDSDNSLIFFSLHQSIAVKLDGEEIYSMKPDARNAFGSTAGCVWNIVRLSSADSGRCYRMGGDEFCILLRNHSLEDCKQRIKRMKEKAEKYNRENSDVLIKIACGYELYDKRLDYDINDTSRRADRMMYHEKFSMKQITAGAV